MGLIWFDEKPDWPDITSIKSFRLWRYKHHGLQGAEVAEVCQRGLDSNGKIKTWGWARKVYDFFDHYQKNKKLQLADVGVQFLPPNSGINTILYEFDGSGDSDPSYMPENRIQATKHGFLPHIRRQTFEQIGNTLHIHNAEARAAGVYFCYDDTAINLFRYLYILHAMTPINRGKRIL
ncbi:unnamed protein product, partial [Mesorhabditis belari]|uniref:Uncharacterized protein n=1 Tax=Mesorhabditis belari TaxID=2138241 RepID=A0AAF3ERB1_9BILA